MTGLRKMTSLRKVTGTRNRFQSLASFAVIAICAVLTLALMVKVNAVRRDLRQTERRIAALHHENLFLETEFETRASQQQLEALNAVDFGYHAPAAGQYVEGERQLALLGKLPGPGAPSPLRVASAGSNEQVPLFTAMVSPLTGKPLGAEPALSTAPDRADGKALAVKLDHSASPATAVSRE